MLYQVVYLTLKCVNWKTIRNAEGSLILEKEYHIYCNVFNLLVY
jgi:hypothetical protein